MAGTPASNDSPDYELCPSGTQGGGGSTPDMKRRTRSLALQDKQWDNLFSQQQVPSKLRQNMNDSAVSETMEQAVAVAKAKLVASQPRMKRKRSRNSREDIFRSKKPGSVRSERQQHPLNRFLSNHPVLANSLCFATPVKDSSDGEPTEVPMRSNHSLVSDTNTHHTADDTVSSTVYYENTKLAGLQQKTPPMPLFDGFQVNDGSEIHRIVATHSHSSQRVMGMYRREMEEWNNKEVMEFSEEEEEEEELVEVGVEEVPQMVHSSSDSTRSSERL